MHYLREREHTKQEKTVLLDQLKETMDLYIKLMSQHSKSSLERENPQGTYDHFNNKWRVNDPAFQELKIPDHLQCPLTNALFVDPILLSCSCVFEKSELDKQWENLNIPDR